MKIGLVNISVALLLSLSLTAQPPDSSRAIRLHSRQLLVGAGSVAAYGTSLVVLNQAWYKGYPRSSFHSFNDGGEWLQMDKIGHGWTAYNASRLGYGMWRWAGVNEKTSVLLGAGSSLLYMLSIEYLDGRSAEWGWSWPDVSADIAGTATFAIQQLALHKQQVNIKWSGHRKKYADPHLEARANQLFGRSLPERLLKDYNSQTYWVSTSVQPFFPGAPPWLNVAIGYGAQGMFGGYKNFAVNPDGTVAFDRRDILRKRQWYIAPDIDLTRIHSRKPFIRSALSVINSIKFPAPALSFSGGKLKFEPLAF